MKASKFSEAQIAFVLKQAEDGSAVAEVSPAVDPRYSYRGEDVVLTLERICKTVGYPKTIRVDWGSEFVSRDLDLWAYRKVSGWTSRGRASRPTTASSNPSTASSEANA
jgi:putative transposase